MASQAPRTRYATLTIIVGKLFVIIKVLRQEVIATELYFSTVKNLPVSL